MLTTFFDQDQIADQSYLENFEHDDMEEPVEYLQQSEGCMEDAKLGELGKILMV